MKKFLFLSLILFVSLILFSACGSGETGEKAPDFSLPALDGGTISLSQHEGKVIILDFWATRCPPCRREIPDFVNLYEQYKDQGLLIIGISLDRDRDTLSNFCNNYDVNYPIAIGNQEVTNAFGGIMYIPTTFIIDRNGNIVKKHVGFVNKSTFESEIKPLL